MSPISKGKYSYNHYFLGDMLDFGRVWQSCRFVPYTFSGNYPPQMAPWDLNIGFQGLASIQDQIYNPIWQIRGPCSRHFKLHESWLEIWYKLAGKKWRSLGSNSLGGIHIWHDTKDVVYKIRIWYVLPESRHIYSYIHLHLYIHACVFFNFHLFF